MGTATKEREQSVKLTESLRGQITASLVSNAIDKRSAANLKASYALAERIYKHVFSAADRRKMEALPEGWLVDAEFLRIEVGRDHHWFCFGPSDAKSKRLTHRVPVKGNGVHQIEPPSDLGKAVIAWSAEAVQITKDREALRSKAREILSAVTTTAKLAEVWPEVKPFLPKFEPRLLPVVRREELNAAFGLKQAAA